MIKYIKIENYIVESHSLDDSTYSIALWHVDVDSLTCELCELLYEPSSSRAFFLWYQLVKNIRSLVEDTSGVSPFEELPFTLHQGNSSNADIPMYRYAEESQK